MNRLILTTIKTAVIRYPAVIPYLKGRARWVVYSLVEYKIHINTINGVVDLAYKTAEFFESTLTRLVRSVYDGNLGGEFIDIMANLISGQLTQAYEQAWKDEEGEGDLPDYLRQSAEDMILNQYDYVDQFYRDIVDARVDEAPIDGLLARVPLWAGQYDTAYREAVRLINLENGGNLEWVKGETERGCNTCASLDGIVMSAREWEQLDVHPRGYPNPKLECEGGGPANNCDCELVPTDKRRSPGAYGRVEEILLARS